MPQSAPPARRPALLQRHGVTLTGVESQTLRAALNLERRHITALYTALGLVGGPARLTNEHVISWERAAQRGYPTALVDALNRLDAAVDDLALRLSGGLPPVGDDGRVLIPVGATRRLVRLRGSRAIVGALNLPPHGLRFDDRGLALLDQDGGSFWQCLMDEALVRAARGLRNLGFEVAVDLDMVADEPINPRGQSALTGGA